MEIFLEAIVHTIHEPLLVLDSGLRVVLASSYFYDTFQVKPEDTIGRLVYELGDGQWNIPQLRELLEDILPNKIVFDNYEVEHAFPEIGRRIMLFNARQLTQLPDRQPIILLVIEDITERKKNPSSAGLLPYQVLGML